MFSEILPTASDVPANPVCGGSLSYTPLVNNNPASLALTGGSLLAGGSCTFSVELDVAAGASNGAYPNTTSEVTGTIDAEPVVGNPATDTLTVVGAPTLRKAFIDDPIAPGDIVTVEFTLVNGAFGDGTSDQSFPATDITFTD